MPNVRDASLSSRVATWGLLASVAASVLALGSLEPYVLCAVALALGAASAGLLLSAPRERALPRQSAVLLICTGAALTLFTALQAVPLPLAVVAWLSPHAADVWRRALSPLSEGPPGWVTLSLDPVATRIEVLRGVAYCATLIGALAIARRRDGAVVLQRAIVSTGAVVALVTLVHYALGVELVYGFVAPKTGVSIIAPLLNQNHLGAYLDVSLIVALGSILSPRPIAPRAILISVVVVLAAVEVWLASRGATAAMVLGCALCVSAAVFAKRDRERLRVVLPVALVTGGVVMGVLAMSAASVQGLADSDVSKHSIARDVFRRMVASYPFFGAGRGAFESTFPEFRDRAAFDVFTHPENIAAQWCAEWGVPVAVVAFCAIAFALRPRTVIARDASAVGPWAALIAVGLQNLVDFSLEVPAVVVSLVLCAAVVVAGAQVAPRSAPAPAFARALSHSRIIAAVVAAATLAGLALVLPVARRELLSEQKRLRLRASAAGPRDVALVAELREAMLDHPAEPYFAYLGAAHAVAGDQTPMPWVEKTLERSPSYAPAHLLLARWLRRRSPSQARLEYRLAAEGGMGGASASEFVSLVSGPEAAMELVPAGATGSATLAILSATVELRMPATAMRIDREILLRTPGHAEAAQRESSRARADIVEGEGAPWCAASPQACARDALAASKRAQVSAPTNFHAFEDQARVLCATGACAQGADVLRQACEVARERERCLDVVATLAVETHQDTVATTAIEVLARGPCIEDPTCAVRLVRAATLEQQRGNANRGLVFLRRAASAAPERDAVIEALANAASAAGLHSEALDRYATLLARWPGDVRWSAHVAAERAALAAR